MRAPAPKSFAYYMGRSLEELAKELEKTPEEMREHLQNINMSYGMLELRVLAQVASETGRRRSVISEQSAMGETLPCSAN